MLNNYRQQLKQMEADYNTRNGKYQKLQEDRHHLNKEIANAVKQNVTLEKTRVLLQKVGNDARETAKRRLEETVTDALKYVFGPDFEFHIELKETRGRVEAEFYVSSQYDGKVVRTGLDEARGGGIIDIVSIALRVALLQIHNAPSIKGPIILDEPGKHVSADYTLKLAEFLKQINQTFNRQIIVSTHQQDLANIADKTIRVDIKGGKSIVE